jgi:enoyl-CoA hydratase/carnithine racemase
MVVRMEDLDFGVRRIVIARPQARNAIDDDVRRRLEREIDCAAADSAVRAVILAGEGAHFSVGGDITFLQTLDRAGFLAFHRDALALVRKLANFPKPMIASVRGACAGGGVGFALCADYLVASRTTYFGVQFMRIGLTPDMGALYFLRQRLGNGARRLILDDRLVRAEEAAALGLCDRLVEDDALDGACVELATRLGALAPKAFRQTKWLYRRTEGEFESFLNNEMTAAADCLGSPEFIEGTRAFFEKRAPRFSAL